MKVLAIGDIADNIATLKKYTEKSSIHLITFPRKEDAILTNSEKGIEFFNSLLISKQVEHIKKIKDNFDICLTMSWAGARVAYLAGLNYLMYFVGGDISTPPFLKKPTFSYLKIPQYNLNYIERRFYKRIFDCAIACIGGPVEYPLLKKIRSDSIRLDRVAVDIELFNDKIVPIKRDKKKFTFLSSQRFGLEKGHDIIWKALNKCKTDFEVLQVKWFIENSEEEKKINKELLENKPSQVKFIPLIKREDLGSYYTFADAILGQMRVGTQGATEREAAFCKKPVICYTNPDMKLIIENIEYIPPFYPESNEPQILADLIDKIVISDEFRKEIIEKQYKYIKNLCSPKKVIEEWEKIFEKILNKQKSINRKISIFDRFVMIWANIVERFYYKKKMKSKNIKAWGKEEYYKLTK